ncbi:hypothetical protein JMUB3870_1545 [Leptotrichia trevisanii]|uniref:Uncharacterized protein n=1 Tax=Leptotrichia trevisanii TaxID=109328 RepID=A0A510K1F6_9FUSO|nr:hypothetical protein JMUB3870_1545 [Leptotrichia trevisanii]
MINKLGNYKSRRYKSSTITAEVQDILSKSKEKVIKILKK